MRVRVVLMTAVMMLAVSASSAAGQQLATPQGFMQKVKPGTLQVRAPESKFKKLGPEAFTESPVGSGGGESASSPTSPGGGDVSTQAAADGNFRCQFGGYMDGFDWSYVASEPAGYVTGSCHDTWHLHRTQRSGTTWEGVSYEGGEIFGDFSGCGWVRSDSSVMVGGGSWGACASPSRNANEFAWIANCHPGQCRDGTVSQNKTNCDFYANVRPWSSNGGPRNYIRTIPAWSNRIAWRYGVKYQYGGQQWLNVRDTGAARGQANWGFIPQSCMAEFNVRPGESLWWIS